MSSGYVLGFSNRTFEEFFREVVGVEIYNPRFDLGSGSKANRMRAFWRFATDEQLRLFLNGLLEGWDVYSGESITQSTRELLVCILKRLGGSSISDVKQEVQSMLIRLTHIGRRVSLPSCTTDGISRLGHRQMERETAIAQDQREAIRHQPSGVPAGVPGRTSVPRLLGTGALA